MLESQLARKARLYPHRCEIQFKPGDEVLLGSTHTPLPSRDKLSPRYMGPFRMLTNTALKIYRLRVDVTPNWRVLSKSNVNFCLPIPLPPLFACTGEDAENTVRVQSLGAGQLEHLVEAILNFSMVVHTFSYFATDRSQFFK